jgi:hypothetical protein
MQRFGGFLRGVLATVALGGVIVGVGSSASVPFASAEVVTRTVKIDQYTLTVPDGGVTPADVLSLVVTGGAPGQNVSLRGDGLDMVDAEGRLVTATSGVPGTAVFNANGDARILFAAHVGGLFGLNGTGVALQLTGEVQLPGRAFQPVFRISSLERLRFSYSTSITAGEPWVFAVSDGRPNTPVSLTVDGRPFRDFVLNANGSGSVSVVFARPRELSFNAVAQSYRDVRGLVAPLTVLPRLAPPTRAAETSSYESFAVSRYTVTAPTGVVYTDEPITVTISGGAPGSQVALGGSHLDLTPAVKPFDANGVTTITTKLIEINGSSIVDLLLALPGISGFVPVQEFYGADRPVPVTTQPATTQPATTQPATTQPATTQPATTQPATTQPATTRPVTTVGPSTGGAFAVSAPDRVAVGERFTASVGGLLPGAIVAFSAESNELGWAVADATGTAKVTNAIWRRGSYSLSAHEIVDGVTVVRSTSRPLQVGATVPTTTTPQTNSFTVTAPRSVNVGQNIVVIATGLDVDSIIEVEAGDVTLGWATVDATGTTSVSNALWASGDYTVTVTEWRYGQKLSTQTVVVTVK